MAQEQAMQMEAKMKPCIKASPPENLPPDYRDFLIGAWHPMKVYDSPLEGDYPYPAIIFTRNPMTGQYFAEVNVIPFGLIDNVPLDFSKYGHIYLNHNKTLSLMGTPITLFMVVTVTLIYIDVPSQVAVIHGCGRHTGPEYMIIAVVSKQKELDPKIEALIEEKLRKLKLLS